jgi:hypothetical protein
VDGRAGVVRRACGAAWLHSERDAEAPHPVTIWLARVKPQALVLKPELGWLPGVNRGWPMVAEDQDRQCRGMIGYRHR